MRSTRVRATILELESEIGSFFVVNNRVERANFCSFHIFRLWAGIEALWRNNLLNCLS